MPRAPVLSLTHGGGPLPVLGDEDSAPLAHSLRTRAPEILRLGTPAAPRAIVVVTAHWETDVVTISSADKHELLYDYGGFPEESYHLKYDAPGSAAIAGEVGEALSKAGLKWKANTTRGWDHGVFIPLLLVYPAATVPVIQVSVLASQSPSDLFAFGEALAPLRSANVAIVGSGSASNHNMQLLMKGFMGRLEVGYGARLKGWNGDMDAAVFEGSVVERRKKFESWRKWTAADEAHPPRRAEHFSPLIVCAGAAGEGAAKAWTDKWAGWEMRSYWWE